MSNKQNRKDNLKEGYTNNKCDKPSHKYGYASKREDKGYSDSKPKDPDKYKPDKEKPKKPQGK